MPTTTFADLPNDSLARVLGSAVLDLNELLTATRTCRAWRAALAEVQTLKLTSAAQCHADALRLCSAATVVIALVVDKEPNSASIDQIWEVRVKRDMAARLAFALTALPQLERLLLKADWHTQCGEFGETVAAHEIGVAAVFGLLKNVCDARAAGLLRRLTYVAHGGHICPCTDFWTGENAKVTAWSEELREEYAACKGRCICRQLVKFMPTETVFSYLISHGLCLGASDVLEALSERGFDLAGPWSSWPRLMEDSAAGPGYPAVKFDFPLALPELQHMWGRPLAYCEVFALSYGWAWWHDAPRVFEDDEDTLTTENERQMYPSFVLHCLVDQVGAPGRELLLRPELADAMGIEIYNKENSDAFRDLLSAEMECRVNASGVEYEDGSE